VENFARYRASADAWMLGGLVCPAARLEDLASHEAWRGLQQAHAVIVATGAEDTDTALARVEGDLQRATSLVEAAAGDSSLRLSLELKLPDADAQASSVPQLFDAANGTATRLGLPLEKVFVEVPFGDAVAVAVSAVASFQWRTNGWFGLKFRTGGLEASAFPSPAKLARAIAACREHGVAWKATAGLHHPLRHYDAGLGTHVHGFLNVLVAATLAHAHRWDAEQIEEVLADEDPADFVFDDEQLRWRDAAVDLEAIQAARGAAMVSFGSCSFEEPVEGLRELGLL